MGYDDLKEEIMRYFSNAPTVVQAIGVLRGIRQRQACLYAARYEFIHNRAHNIQPEEQTQVSVIGTMYLDSLTQVQPLI